MWAGGELIVLVREKVGPGAGDKVMAGDDEAFRAATRSA